MAGSQSKPKKDVGWSQALFDLEPLRLRIRRTSRGEVLLTLPHYHMVVCTSGLESLLVGRRRMPSVSDTWTRFHFDC